MQQIQKKFIWSLKKLLMWSHFLTVKINNLLFRGRRFWLPVNGHYEPNSIYCPCSPLPFDPNQSLSQHSPQGFKLQSNSRGRREAAVHHCTCISSVVKSVCLSLWQQLLPRAPSPRFLYRAAVRHHWRIYLLWKALPALMSLLMMGATLKKPVTSQGWSSSPPCFSSFLQLVPSVCEERQRCSFLWHSEWQWRHWSERVL